LFWNRIIANLQNNATKRNSKTLDSRRLEKYLRVAISKNDSRFNLQNIDNIRISNIKRVGGGLINNVYSFLLTYSNRYEKKQLQLIIKTYKENVDPVRRALPGYMRDCDLRMCIREWQALRSLEDVGLAVPKAYLSECDSRFIGYPFLIMAKTEKLQKNSEDYVEGFAESLANLHNLDVDKLGIEVLKSLKNGYEFADRWPIHFKHVLNIETKHNAHLKKDFDFAISWLESNISNNYCPRYSLIHGDSHPANAFLTNDSRITLVDWDSVTIGDPAFDVSNSYHMIKFFRNPKDPDSAELLAERFLSKYLKKSKTDIRSRLKFYQLVSLLGYSITYSSGFSSPIKAYKYHQRKVSNSFPFLKLPIILLAFPFLRWSSVARQIQAENELYWLKYFEKFIEKLKQNKN
jgi:thiamine kinase-like enzyme